MKINPTFFVLFALLFAACSTPPTPAPTVDVIPSATLTILPPTETPAATPIPTPALLEGGMSVEQLTPYIFSKDLLDHPEKIAKMSFEELTSEEFVKGALNMLQQGKLPVPPDTAVPMHHVVLGNPLDIDGSGVGGYFFPDSPSSYIDSKHLPYVPSLLIETEIQGVRAYLGILVFVNSDKSYGLFGDVILPRSKVGLVDMLKSSLTLNADGRYYVGSLHKDIQLCRQYYEKYYDLLGKSTAFCEWAIRNQNGDIFINELMQVWANSDGGKLQNMIVVNNSKKYVLPISVALTKRAQ